MVVIEVRPSKKFKGAWCVFELDGVEPAFSGLDAKRKAIDYAWQRFGGRSGEVRIYNDAGEDVEETIKVDDRGQYERAT